MAERDERFLSRWSRLKHNAREDVTEPAATEAAVEAAAIPAEGDADEEREAAENRRAAEAIDIDALRYGDDFSPFMKRGVPEPLRRRALRKFFASDPLLANLDGLNDYDEDFNNPEFMVYRSAWDAARGFLTEAEKAAQQATGRLTATTDLEAGSGESVTEATADAAPERPETPETMEPDAETTVPEVLPVSDPETAANAPREPDAEAEPEPERAPRRVSIRRRLDG
jgi:hypothetical protein